METDVLIVGCGPAGLTAAVALATYGVKVLAITKHSELSPTPRAHVTNQRSFEIMREFGIEQAALALASNYDEIPDEIFMRSVSGLEFGRIRGMHSDHYINRSASPCVVADFPQHLLEPLFYTTASRAGATVRFDTELTAFGQDDDGVTATLRDRVADATITVRAKYLIGADGGRSVVAERLSLPFEGRGEIGGSLNIYFESDLSARFAHRPSLLNFIVRTADDEGGAGLGFLRCIKPFSRWLLTKGYSSGKQTPWLEKADTLDVLRDYLGLPDLEARILDIDPWPMNATWATRYSQGRVFCAGDAVHRHVPSNGLGANTGIQEAYNLAWKLAHVLQGKAGPGLLASYDPERVPLGRLTVERATKSMEGYTPILSAIGVLDDGPAGEGDRAIASLTDDTPAAAERRTALRDAIHAKVYEYQARGFELNQLYRSGAIVDEGQEPAASDADPELFYRPTSCPGAKVPHAWVQRDGRSLSTLDLVGRGRFTLLTGIGGEAWSAAADAAAKRFGIDLAVVRIGLGCEIEDLYGTWADRREIDEDGCLLVRPDGYVAWRCRSGGDEDVSARLVQAVAMILDKVATEQAGHG